tara:strand:+ start:752 stop:925 length:174 start_codon:yes stop_codon:yes gene_type:complete
MEDIIKYKRKVTKMTIQELIKKLEETRYFLESSEDDNVRQAFDNVNMLIHDLETGGY